MTINKSLFSSLPQFPTLRLGSCLHYALVRVFTNQLPTSLGSCFQEPFISSLRYGSCPHEPILTSLGSGFQEPITHIPWFVSSRTIYMLHTHLGSCFYKPIIHSIRLGSCLHYALVRVFTNQLPIPLVRISTNQLTLNYLKL